MLCRAAIPLPRPHRRVRIPPAAADKDTEILVLRHQLAILQRQVGKPQPAPPDRAFLAALLHRIPKPTLRKLHLIVSPLHHPALAPRPPPPTPHPSIPSRAPRSTTYRPQHPSARPPARPREPELGLPPHPRRTRHPGHQGRSLHRLGNPPNQRHRTGASSQPPDLGHLPTQPSNTPSSPPTSSKPEPRPAQSCSSSPSLSTPPAASASSAQPLTPPRPGPPNWPETSSWISRTPAPPL
jgi:hypothetical protein